MVSGCRIYENRAEFLLAWQNDVAYLIYSNNITFRLLLPDNDNLVAGEDELGNDGGEPPHKVATTINHDRLRRYSRHLLQEYLGLDNQLSSIRRNLTCEL